MCSEGKLWEIEIKEDNYRAYYYKGADSTCTNIKTEAKIMKRGKQQYKESGAESKPSIGVSAYRGKVHYCEEEESKSIKPVAK